MSKEKLAALHFRPELAGAATTAASDRGVVRPLGSSRLLRATARALCALLFIESAPTFALEVTLRSEPRGWAQVSAWAETAARGAELGAERLFEDAGSLLDRLSLFASSGSQGSVAGEAQAAVPFPTVPPAPPGFSQAAPQGAEGPEAAAVAISASDVALLPAWNLASLPTRPIDPSPASVFASLGSSLRRAYAYDACDTADPWKLYDPADPAGSDLTSVDERAGLWIDASGAGGLSTPGDPPLGTTIHLCPGWNLIGFPAAQARPVASALVSIAGKYSRVFGYDAGDTTDPWEVYDVAVPAWANDLQLLRPGRGYWILATAPADLAIGNLGTELAVDIAQPAQLAEVTEPTAIVGSVQGQALASWELRYRSLEGPPGEWTMLATGTGPVSNEPIATFDPTLLLNGIVEIELSALDLSGGGVSVSTHVLVIGQQKIGNFTLSFNDLEIPISGLPIQIVRTYDSREKRSLDFGYGWTLDIRQGSYRNNRKPGDGWRIVQGFVPCQVAQETKPHLTTIRLSEREIYRFRLSVTRPAITAGGCFAEAGFAFVDGPVPGAVLSILGGTSVFYANDTSEVVDTESFALYEPQSVRLTTRDGRVFDLNLATGVTRLADSKGNELQVSAAGITHSDGRGILLSRDAEERITEITDPLGNSIIYAYNQAGDLTSVTDREGSRTHFTYNASHGLLTILDARGIQSVRNDYDADGRLIRHTDALGKTIELSHDLANRREVITDRLGKSRVLDYDSRGNLTRELDALGKVTTRTFDERDKLLSSTNPLSQVTRYSYDAMGNLSRIEDPLGQTSSYSYNLRGQILTTTDARGKTTTNTYASNGNLLLSTNPLGYETSYTYDSRGRLLSLVDPEGASTRYTYDSFGNVAQEIDALGTATLSTYDAAGNLLTRTTERTTPTGLQALQWAWIYDRNDRIVATIDPDNTSTQSVLDTLGNVVDSIDKLGRHTQFSFDAMGRPSEKLYPDGTRESSIYDAEGRILTSIDRSGRATNYAYDSVGRLQLTISPDGTTFSSTYDDAGRLEAHTDARGNTTRYFYDAAGRTTKVLDALGHETNFGYDPSGNQIVASEPNGNSTTFEYDDIGRGLRSIFPDGTISMTAYDKNGRRTTEVDAAGRETQFSYDALGRLVGVRDALNQIIRYGYDEQGNRISWIDANGNETRFDYDQLGRQIKRVTPQVNSTVAEQSFTYDALGNQKTRVDFNGALTTYTHDINNRVASRSYPDGSSVGFTYTPTGRRASATDFRGTTTYEYDSRDRLASLVYPDGRRLAYSYDAAGNRASLVATIGASSVTSRFTYDALNKLQSVIDPQGRPYTYTYDDNGNRASLTHPNGVTTAYTYDTLNRLAALRTKKGSGELIQGYTYRLGAVGNRTQVAESDGTVRDYSYDLRYRLTDEHVTRDTATLWRNSFVYDPAGNRLTRNHMSTTGGQQNAAFAYDSRGRLVSSESVSYGWDENGNLLSQAGVNQFGYAWDFENRLLGVSLADGTVVSHTYDPDGNRVRTVTTSNGSVKSTVDFLVDPGWRLSASGIGSTVSQVVAESSSEGIMALHIRGDEVLATVRPNATRYLHAEGIGTIRFLTDEEGDVTDRYTLDAFGAVVDHEGTDANQYLSAGEPFDPVSQLYSHRARWRSPDLGSFVNEDPLMNRARNYFAGASYVYAAQRPTDLVDPSGLLEGPQLAGLLAVTAAVYGIIGNSYVMPSLRGFFTNKHAKVFVKSQPIIIAGSHWDEEEAEAVLAQAASFWSKAAGIVVQSRPIITLNSSSLLDPAYHLPSLPAELGTLGTLFVRSIQVKGKSSVGGYGGVFGDTGFTLLANRSDKVLAHEWGHVFGLPHEGATLMAVSGPLQIAVPFFLNDEQVALARNTVLAHRGWR